jgi:integrase
MSVEVQEPLAALERIGAALSERQARMLQADVAIVTAALRCAAPARHPRKRSPEGVSPRHSRSCASRTGGACNCEPTWEAWVFSKTDKAKIRKTFGSRRAARAWRHQLLGMADQGQLRTPGKITLAQAGERWLEMAGRGEITNRSGRRYKPSALRTIEQDLRLRLIPELGGQAMSDVTRADMQRRVGEWLARGLSPSKVRAVVIAARVIWRDLDLITGADDPLLVDPTKGLRLPASTGRRERVATAREARKLLAALDEGERALWATAMYAGLRLGELRALRVKDIDLAHRRINVRRGWDQYEGEITPKTDSSRRPTVIVSRLEELLREHLARTARSGEDLVFGRDWVTPFAVSSVNDRARRAWARARSREDEEGTTSERERIRPIGLHECRHTAVSQMLDAGISIVKVSKMMGHASIRITIDRYGHLLPGGEAQAASLLDAYHENQDE